MNILYICSEFYAGMMPFGANIVNAMNESEHEIFGVFVCSPQCDYRKTIVDVNEEKRFIFIDTPMNKFNRGYFRLFAFPVIKAIKKICNENKIDVIHLLTEDGSLALYLESLKNKSVVFYTVHDLKQHESKPKKNISKILNYLLIERRVNYLIKNVNNLVTCSKEQYTELMDIYKDKKVYFHNFPSLITQSIEKGEKVIPELKNINNYILFFGRFELYKGIHILYDEYCRNILLQTRPLVLAGSGDIYFKRNKKDEDKVIFINRYIEDDELNSLFYNAYCVIYPYISATQSGVLSLAYHFNKPVIASEVPFFRECIIDKETGFLFDINNPDSLGEIFYEMENRISKKSDYDYFNVNVLREQLKGIYL